MCIRDRVLVPLVSLVTKKPESKRVEEIFSCYEEKVTVPHVVALEEE